ncbi:MAG: hypothetical protein FWG51_02125 [Firmicutes bacterium]|nr:hypothetical protein [Bacillota bacterium]
MLTKPFKKLFMTTLIAALFFTAAFNIIPFADAIDASWYNDELTVFEIDSAFKLAEFSKLVNSGISFKGKVVFLTDDINLNVAPYNEGEGWMPIGMRSSFKGSFYGNNKTISGLYINRDKYAGLFGNVAGYIFDIYLIETDITGKSHTGGIAGWIQEGVIKNCYVDGSVKGNSYIGGIAGYIGQYGKVENCCSAAEVFSDDYSGGIVGFSGLKGKIKNCYSTGNISGKEKVGGILGGTNANGGKVEYCYSTGKTEGGSYVGGIVGDIVHSADKVVNCVALNPSVSGSSYTGRVAGNNKGTLLKNYAYSGMQDKDGDIIWNNKFHNQINGQDLDFEKMFSGDFWEDEENFCNAAFDTDVWGIKDGNLPILKNIKYAQDADNSHLRQNGAKASAPTLASKTKNSITINAVIFDNGQVAEYAINTTDTAPDSGWQADLTFIGLIADTTYYIFARSKVNAKYLTGAPSESLTVLTDAGEIILAGADVSAPTLASKTKNSITINAVILNPNNGQIAEYAISTTNVMPSSGWQEGLVFANLSADTTYYIFARSKANDQYLTGTAKTLTVRTDAEKDNNDGLSDGVVAGIVIACVALIIFAGVLIYLIIKKKKQNK